MWEGSCWEEHIYSEQGPSGMKRKTSLTLSATPVKHLPVAPRTHPADIAVLLSQHRAVVGWHAMPCSQLRVSQFVTPLDHLRHQAEHCCQGLWVRYLLTLLRTTVGRSWGSLDNTGRNQCTWKGLSPRSVAMPRLLLSSELVRWHRIGQQRVHLSPWRCGDQDQGGGSTQITSSGV